jgi:hypothetical protein
LNDSPAVYRRIIMQVSPFGAGEPCEHYPTVIRTFLLDHARLKQSLVAAEDRSGLSYVVEFHVHSTFSPAAIGGGVLAKRKHSTNLSPGFQADPVETLGQKRSLRQRILIVMRTD